MKNPFDLSGRVILVTGASSGIGKQICFSVAGQGGSIIATGRNENNLKELIVNLPGKGHDFILADLTSEGDRKELVQKLPVINGLVYSAGVVKFIPAKFYSEKHFQEIRGINYDAAFLLIQELLKKKLIAGGGAIVLISSIMGMIGVKGNGIYAGTKGAMISTARVLALELSSMKIRVNCLAPGMVKTPMAENTKEAVSSEAIAEDEKRYPFGYGNPEDIANPAVFLLSDASKWITGTTIVLDGGYTCM